MMKRKTSQAGTSLLESLIATTLLLFIAVSLFPLFYRASANNTSGSDSNRVSQQSRSRLEGLLGLDLDSPIFDMKNKLPDHTITPEGDGEVMTLGTRYWDRTANVLSTPDPTDPTHYIANPAWITDPASATGVVKWRRTSAIRYYAYADIGSGVIDTTNPGQLADVGHPHLLDKPLKSTAAESQINFTEEDVAVESLRPGVPEFKIRFMRVH